MLASRKNVLKILRKFDKSKVNYAIMRNWEFLTKDVRLGKDIDIVIDSKSVGKVGKILLKEGFVREKISPYSHHFGYAKYFPKELKLVKFHFHVGGISGRHVTYLSANQILNRRERISKYYVLSPEDLYISLVLHSPGSKRYSKVANKLKKLDKRYLSVNLINIFGRSLGTRVFSSKFSDLRNLKKQIRSKVFWSNPIGALYVTGMSVLWYLPKLILGSPVISFIGMDGAGKTTATSKMVELLKEHRIKSELVYVGRGRGNILPIQFFGRKYKQREKRVDSNSKKNDDIKFSRKVIYSLSAPVFYFDFLLRYFKVFVARRTKKLVLTDRFATDFLIMKNVPLWLRNLLYLLSPKPNAVIYLYNSPKLLYKRKPDHPAGDLERQEKLYASVLEKVKKVHRVKSVNEKQTVRDVSEIIFDEIISN
ncbi:MAG: nucleotidyltransferase family protein [Candidatus Nanoarchaeia archaeon]|nr:nucleotidyltransferase family protein [Candidatus Nanoarchaeia archaeon]|tara:strand:+ start:3105 stop:4373 length:1269 start_codon:yes stop_codon:yes gene_type:complete